MFIITITIDANASRTRKMNSRGTTKKYVASVDIMSMNPTMTRRLEKNMMITEKGLLLSEVS